MCHYSSYGLAHIKLSSGEVTVSWSKAELLSLGCGGTGIMADIFGTSSELHHLGSAFSFCLFACFVFICILLSALGKEIHVYLGILNMSK